MNTETKPLVVEHIYKASPDRVWEAITDIGQMRKWYFPDLDGFRPEIGFKFTFSGNSDCGEYIHDCVVTEVEQGSKLTYSWSYRNYPGMSYVTWDLYPHEGGTLLVLTHKGLETFPQDLRDFTRESFTGGWTYFVNEALPEFLEE